MGIQPNVERSEEQESDDGFHEISFGKVRARIYRNESQKEGVYYRVKFFRRETNKEKTKRWLATSFFREDLVNVAKAATASYIWLLDNTDYVPAFSSLIESHSGDMRAFYSEVRQLAALEKSRRAAALQPAVGKTGF